MKSFNLLYLDEDDLRDFIATNKIPNSPKVLIQIFTGINDIPYIKDLLKELDLLLDKACINGATTDGEIDGNSVTTKQTVITFSIFQKTSLQVISNKSLYNGKDSYELGYELGNKLAESKPKAIITFATLGINGEEYIKGIEYTASNTIVAGGIAADNGEFKTTYVFDKHNVISSGIVSVGLYNNDLQVHTGYSFNWMSIGKELTITKSDANRVYMIDDLSAVDTYRKYLGDDIADGLPSIGVEFPLIIKKDGLKLARAVLEVNTDGSLVFAGNINNGDKVQFGIGNANMILAESTKKYKDFQNNSIESIFVYSCMARRRFLQSSIFLELSPLMSISNVSGFFTYGEFFTNSINNKEISKNELLNETMTILALSEGDSKDLQEDYNAPKTITGDFAKTLSALSNLINVSTKEIDDLNSNLEQKVKQEIEKNVQKDKILQRQTRMAQMGEMLSMIAHQWRQPLATIGAITATLELENSLGVLDLQKLDEELNSINDQIKYLSHTINDFRNFFNPNKDKEKISLKTLIDKTLTIIEKTIHSKGIKLDKQYTKVDAKITTYQNEVMQVLLNIIKNAIDIFDEKNIKDPLLIIDILVQEDRCIIIIKDNAGGIPEYIVNKIFDPYFSTKNEKNGTGLGLYMSKTIIEDHCNGSLIVDNIDNGAKFSIVLPLD